MARIVRKQALNQTVTRMEVQAPLIAKKALPGQFIILRLDEVGERIPLTIADCDPIQGTVTIIFQTVGLTTGLLAGLNTGDDIRDFAGPLGVPTHIPDGVKRACIVGGGVGCAIAYPQAKSLHAAGVEVDVIAGFRTRDLVILEQELSAVSTRLCLTTDDGSYGIRGFVTDTLKGMIQAGSQYDLVIAIGPVPMMKFVCKVTEPFGIPTVVSVNPLMVDGTGMCGCCRVTVGGKVRFACVEGPDFDGHQVDFDELMMRNARFRTQEEAAREQHACRMEQLAQSVLPDHGGLI